MNLDFPLVVADGQTTSPGKDMRTVIGEKNSLNELHDFAITSLETPAMLEATTATLQFSHDDVTYFPYYDDAGSAISITVGTSRVIRLRPSDYPVLMPYVRVVLGTAASGASRTVRIGLRKV